MKEYPRIGHGKYGSCQRESCLGHTLVEEVVLLQRPIKLVLVCLVFGFGTFVCLVEQFGNVAMAAFRKNLNFF